VQRYSHGETGTSITTAPAMARITKPAAMAKMSSSTTCFSQREYDAVIAT